MYKLESIVKYSECNPKSKLKYHALFDYLQNTSTLHSEELGQSGADLLEKNMAWILSFYQVCIDRMPDLSEHMTVSTWPYSTKGLFGCRNYLVEDAQTESIIRGNSIWVLVDPRTGRPVRITEEVSAHYPDEEKLEMNYCDRKIDVPAVYEEMEPITVPKYFIDTNNHMNNAKYVMVAEEYLPENFEVREIRVEFKMAAILGDVLIPRISLEEDRFTVVLVDEAQKPYATVLFLKA